MAQSPISFLPEWICVSDWQSTQKARIEYLVKKHYAHKEIRIPASNADKVLDWLCDTGSGNVFTIY